MRRLLVLCLAAAALIVFLSGLPRGESTPAVRTETATPAAAVVGTTPSRGSAVTAPAVAPEEPSPRSADPLPAAPALGPLPASLAGTEVDGSLVADDGGRLVVTRETRAFFDYFLAASGEESPRLLKARIVDALHARLPGLAAGEATALLERYLLYRERARAVSTSDPEVRWRHLRDLRREVLGPSAAEAFFGEEEKLDAFALEARRIREQAEGERKRRLLAELEKELSPEARKARAEATSPLRLLDAERTLAKSGVSGDELRRERETRWGEAVADRLESLQTARAEWNRRLRDFREQRAAVLHDESLAPEERASAVDAMLSRNFTPEERRRVLALDRIEKN